MKQYYMWLFLAIGPCLVLAQTTVSKIYPYTKGQKIDFHFDYPKIVRISTWESNEISVYATLKSETPIPDKVFTLLDDMTNDKIVISNKLNLDLIPYTYHVEEGGRKIRFDTKQEMDNYLADKGDKKIAAYHQRNIEVIIEIKVPKNASTGLTSVYGMVEVRDFNGPIKVDATYGGVDAALIVKSIGNLQLTNHYGKIYSDINLEPTSQTEKNFYTSIIATPGSGHSYNFSSSYGNIYLRNPIK